MKNLLLKISQYLQENARLSLGRNLTYTHLIIRKPLFLKSYKKGLNHLYVGSLSKSKAPFSKTNQTILIRNINLRCHSARKGKEKEKADNKFLGFP